MIHIIVCQLSDCLCPRLFNETQTNLTMTIFFATDFAPPLDLLPGTTVPSAPLPYAMVKNRQLCLILLNNFPFLAELTTCLGIASAAWLEYGYCTCACTLFVYVRYPESTGDTLPLSIINIDCLAVLLDGCFGHWPCYCLVFYSIV